jgi:ADP-ribose pyrophosphatase
MRKIDDAGAHPGVLFEGRYLRLLSQNGWEYVERVNCTGIAVIVALTPEREVLLVEQFRLPVRGSVIEFPAGLVGDVEGVEHESVEEAAKRELFEETGYEASSLVLLTEGPPSSGLSTEIVSFFGALDIVKTGEGGGDDTESIVLHMVHIESIDDWLAQKSNEGVLVDPKVYGGVYLIKRLIGGSGG